MQVDPGPYKDMWGRNAPSSVHRPIVCNIVSAGSTAFWWSIFGFGSVGRGGVNARQDGQGIDKRVLTKFWERGKREGEEGLRIEETEGGGNIGLMETKNEKGRAI